MLAWLCEFGNRAPDHLAHRKSKQLGGAGTSVQATAVVVGDHDRDVLMRDNGPEQQLQLVQAIVDQAATGFVFRGHGVHCFSFAPSIQETVWSKRQAGSARMVSKTAESRDWRSASS